MKEAYIYFAADKVKCWKTRLAKRAQKNEDGEQVGGIAIEMGSGGETMISLTLTTAGWRELQETIQTMLSDVRFRKDSERLDAIDILDRMKKERQQAEWDAIQERRRTEVFDVYAMSLDELEAKLDILNDGEIFVAMSLITVRLGAGGAPRGESAEGKQLWWFDDSPDEGLDNQQAIKWLRENVKPPVV